MTLKEFQEFSAAGKVAVKNMDARVEKVAAAMIATSEDFSKTMVELRLILQKVNTGPGTAARFVNDGRFYENLLENTEQLQLLLNEIKTFVEKLNEEGVKVKL